MFSNYETMKILIYNWAPLDLNIGGGVAVYVKNVLDYLSKTADNDHIDVVFCQLVIIMIIVKNVYQKR